VVWDDIVGEFSDIDADVLGVNGGGQECPPYTAGLALLGGRTGRPAYVCLGSVRSALEPGLPDSRNNVMNGFRVSDWVLL
jgi:hypothetical protein